MKPHGRLEGVVAFCSYKWHRGDLTNDMIFENGCIEKNCYNLIILNKKYKKRVERCKRGELSQHDMYQRVK